MAPGQDALTPPKKALKSYLLITEKGVYKAAIGTPMNSLLDKKNLIAKRFINAADLSGNGCMLNINHIISIHPNQE